MAGWRYLPFFALGFAGCGARSTHQAGMTSAASAAAIAPPEPIPTAAATATLDPAPEESARALPGFAGLRAQYPDLPPWPSGPGVACGERRCGKDEICCQVDEARECLPAAREAECRARRGATLAMAVSCDESSDCRGAERCCEGRLGKDEDGIRVRCATPRECSVPWDPPGGFGIPAEEICARGGTCKTPGSACMPVEGGVSGGRCVTNVARVSCGKAGLCPPDKPWCHWDAAAHTAECIPRGPWHHQRGVLECDDRADCPGAWCCEGNGFTFCSKECEPELAYASLVCKKPKDCGRRGDLVSHCAPSGDLPPGMGTCSFGRREDE